MGGNERNDEAFLRTVARAHVKGFYGTPMSDTALDRETFWKMCLVAGYADAPVAIKVYDECVSEFLGEERA